MKEKEILQKFLQYLSSVTDDIEENPISSLNSHNSNNVENIDSDYINRYDILASPDQWPNNTSHLTHQMKCLTISEPTLRDSPSLAYTSVNHKVQNSVVFVNENGPENVRRRRKSTRIRSHSGVKEQREDEGPSTISCGVVAKEGRWIKHYSSCHRILLVGEGDFSFSRCLAAAFGRASNMIATSLDSQEFLAKNYENAMFNLFELSIRECEFMHGIDATKMADHALLGDIKFDRIIFNFPFAGFFKDLPRDSQLKLHRRLVSRFLKNAKEMISENGEIHITHKTNGFHKEWNLESLASSHWLKMIETVDFSLLDYPGYNTKRGFGGDDNFNCYPSMTYKFGLKF